MNKIITMGFIKKSINGVPTKYIIVAMRGRYKGNKTHQKLEINKGGYINCLTTVLKDNLVLEIYNVE
jgi:hypothetical protein